ncbi:EamA family transporter [Bradyrhizobium sp. S69]|uniref:EamA family transporter n=1 Tax=Bradyrhizobium sp. S69 TaxID=1641856 RepID=UPI00131C3B02|nr:EamA family transporter [Bradyrhizobium sp. S69]
MSFQSWQVWALLSAVFAALTAIFAKIGVENINSDLATFIRTIVVLVSFLLLLLATGQFVPPQQISGRTWTFLVLSGLGTGASWLCYFRALKLGPASLVAPVDKLSVVLVAIFGVLLLGERPSPTGWLGIAMIGCGAVLIAVKI